MKEEKTDTRAYPLLTPGDLATIRGNEWALHVEPRPNDPNQNVSLDRVRLLKRGETVIVISVIPCVIPEAHDTQQKNTILLLTVEDSQLGWVDGTNALVKV